MQYRLLEFLFGNKNPEVITVHQRDPQAYAALQRALEAPSLYDEVLRLLSRAATRSRRLPGARLQPAVRASKQVAGRVARRVPQRRARAGWDLYELAERLVDLDHNFQLWRCHHLKTVERIIGYKPGTGGTGGVCLPRQGAGAEVLPGAVDDPHLDVGPWPPGIIASVPHGMP